MNKQYKCFICSLQISEINTLKSHIRIIHNIKDGPYLVLQCCNNQKICNSKFLSYSAFSRHMLDCINSSSKSSTSSKNINNDFGLTKYDLNSGVSSNFDEKIIKNSVVHCRQNVEISTNANNQNKNFNPLSKCHNTNVTIFKILNSPDNSKNVNDLNTKIAKFPHLTPTIIAGNLNNPNQNVNNPEPLTAKNSSDTNQNVNNSSKSFVPNQIPINPNSKNENTNTLLSNIVQLNLPETTTNKIFTNFTSYINSTSDDLLSFVLSNDFNDTQQYKSLIDKVNNLKSPFTSISTSYRRRKKLTSAPDFVSPQRIVVGTEYKPVLHISRLYVKKPKQICFSYVPILKTLELTLRNEEVKYHLRNPLSNEENVYKSPSDGSAVKNCEFYKDHPNALKIILYFDEYETVNPLGSKTGKHKMGALYMTLANLPYHVNSKLKSIFLVAKFKCSDLKKGKISFDDILKPVITDITKLEEGVKLNQELHYGTILTISADNLGANSIFGFVESFKATHFCRYCSADSEKCSKMIKENESFIRTVEEYEKSYHQFKAENAKNKKVVHKFGVKHISLLIKLKFYSTFNNMTFDAMHDILEGVLQYDLKFFVQYLIAQKILTLDQINERIEAFDYGPINNSSKPSIFKVTKKGHLINQRASQAWCLLSVFPLMFADVITSVHKSKFKIITTLIEIAKIVLSPEITKSMINSLRTLIEVHHRIVLNHFRSKLTPKFHFLVHYPSMIERMGPPLYYWCMRFEGKHNFFVDLVNKLKNYKNICMTLSMRHQINSYQFWGDSKSKIDSFLFGKQTALVVPSAIRNLLDTEIPNKINSFSFFSFNSIKFAPKYFLIHKTIENIPHFAEIIYIYKHENKIQFLTKIWNTEKYNSEYSAYSIKASNNMYKLISFKSLKYFETFNKLQNYRRTDWFIVMKNSCV